MTKARIYLIFLVMGFGDLIGPLVSLVKEKLQISQFEASFIAFTGFIMFGTLSIPVGVLQARLGRKLVAIGGLILVLAGVTTPLIGLVSYAGYLTAVLLLGAGVTILQVAGGPLLQEVSAAGAFARNLTFGQFVKGIGTLSAPLIPILAYRCFDNRWELVFPIFAAGTVVALAAMIFHSKGQAGPLHAATFAECFALLTNRRIALLVLGIFLYVGAEVCISSMLPSIIEKQYGYNLADYGMAGTGIFFLSLMAGRFAGSIVLARMRPSQFFLLSCTIALAGLSLLAIGSDAIGFVAAALIGLGFANLFPLVYAIAMELLPTKANEISGLVVTAICGGAIVPPVMGYVSEHSSLTIALAVPTACIVYLTTLAIYGRKHYASAT